MRYFVSAGEASGDLHGGALLRALRDADPQASFEFLGGDEMACAAGHAPLIHYRKMAYMGFAEVLRHLPDVARNLATARRALETGKFDALILIDYPSFNLKLAGRAVELGIPVYYYIAPKVWAWKEWRVKSIRKLCRKVLSILPFEVEYFRGKGVEVEYVGNPSAEEIAERQRALQPVEDFLRANSLSGKKPLLAIVPGSRVGELRNNLPVMLEAAKRFPGYQPVVAMAPGLDAELYERFAPGVPRVEGQTFQLMASSAAALVTSGTATLECALLGTPQVVCYRGSGSKAFYNIMKHVLKCPFVSLPNLIAGRAVVAELLMHHCNADEVSAELEKILPGAEGRGEMLEGYSAIKAALGGSHAAEKAATTIVADLTS